MPTKNIDIESAARSTLESDPVFKSLLSMYASKLGPELKDLEGVLHQKAWHDVKEQAHRLKGTASMYGFATLSELIARCEHADKNAEAYQAAQEGLAVARQICDKLAANYPP